MFLKKIKNFLLLTVKYVHIVLKIFKKGRQAHKKKIFIFIPILV